MRHIILWQKNKGSCGYDGLATIHLFLEPNTAIIYASYFSEYFYYSRYDSLHLTIYWCIWLLSRSIFDSLCVLKFLVLSCHHYPSPAKHVEHRTYHMQISFYNLGFFFSWFMCHVENTGEPDLVIGTTNIHIQDLSDPFNHQSIHCREIVLGTKSHAPL